MARLKLIQYLNDPTLLEQISEEEMMAWAKEVPYAGLVQRLLAQKLAIENSKKAMTDKATTMAILSNANPDQVIKSIDDFKNLILSNTTKTTVSVDSNAEESFTSTIGHGISDQDSSTIDEPLAQSKKEEQEIGENEYEDTIPQEENKTVIQTAQAPREIIQKIEQPTTRASKDVEMSEFSKWLISLQTLTDKTPSDDHEIELEDKDLASDALAQLLVSQGHYQQAIAMYEILMLKVPQKSSFFADQIQKLKSL